MRLSRFLQVCSSRPALAAMLSLVVAGCGSQTTSWSDAGARRDRGVSDGVVARDGFVGSQDATVDLALRCQGCKSDQLCEHGVCVDLPKQCPPQGCPKRSYCDLASNHCVAGCLEDSTCGDREICEQRQCLSGCRDDSGCGAGTICENLACRAGCRRHDQCSPDKACIDTRCQAGCREHTQCALGKICTANQCVSGCTGDSRCSAGNICDGGKCRPGCRPATANCGSGASCCADTFRCEACCADGDCPSGQICQPNTATGGRSCRPGCRIDSDCTTTAKPTYADPFQLEGYCSPVTNTCYPKCWRDDSVQGSPLRCNGTCISLGTPANTNGSPNICVPDLNDPGIPACAAAQPNASGVCQSAPSCPTGTVCAKVCKGDYCEYALAPTPSWYHRCLPAHLVNLPGYLQLTPCSSCGSKAVNSCAAGDCKEISSGNYRCVDWCRSAKSC